jgi:hypothetical protein
MAPSIKINQGRPPSMTNAIAPARNAKERDRQASWANEREETGKRI